MLNLRITITGLVSVSVKPLLSLVHNLNHSYENFKFLHKLVECNQPGVMLPDYN